MLFYEPPNSQSLGISSRGVGSSSEQVWTGPQSWLPGVTTRGLRARTRVGRQGSLYRWGLGPGGPCKEGRGSLYGKIKGNMSNGHMGTPIPVDRQTDMTENIPFQELHWGAVINFEHLKISNYPLFPNKEGNSFKCTLMQSLTSVTLGVDIGIKEIYLRVHVHRRDKSSNMTVKRENGNKIRLSRLNTQLLTPCKFAIVILPISWRYFKLVDSF